MSEEFDKLVTTAVKSEEQAAELVEKLFAVAQPGAVFGEPVTVGEQTVITASEVKVGMGFGFGTGGGTGVVSAGTRKRARVNLGPKGRELATAPVVAEVAYPVAGQWLRSSLGQMGCGSTR